MWKAVVFVMLVSVGLGYTYHKWTYLPPLVRGGSSEAFKLAARSYVKLLQDNMDSGSSFSVYYNGQQVLDMQGGYADREFQLAFTGDTLTQTFTMSHVPSVLAMLHLLERGVVTMTDEISSIVPSCRLHNVTIHHLLTHSNTHYTLSTPLRLALLQESAEEFFSHICDHLTTYADSVQLGSHSALQVHSAPLLFDMISRHLDTKNRPLGRLFVEEFAWPLSLDIQVGLPRTQTFRLARTYHPLAGGALAAFLNVDVAQLWALLRGRVKWDAAVNWFTDLSWSLNYNPELNELPLASLHTFTTAKSLSQLLNSVLLQQKRWLQPIKSIQLLNTTQREGYDEVLQGPVAYSCGLMIRKSHLNSHLVGWLDPTGNFAFADMTHNVTFAYVTNHLRSASFGADVVFRKLTTALYEALHLVLRQVDK